MDTVKKKVERASSVGRQLVKQLIPYGEKYIAQFLTEFEQNRELAFRLTTVGDFKVRDPERLWVDTPIELQAVCNNLILGCLYSAMYISKHFLNERLDTKIQRYLELEFFNVLDQVETPNGQFTER